MSQRRRLSLVRHASRSPRATRARATFELVAAASRGPLESLAGHLAAEAVGGDRYEVVVHVADDGEVLSVGGKTRQIPPAIRHAFRFRDRGCRFPGCTNRRFVDAHHIEHWADGGETKLGNLVLLCRVHHTLVHEGGWVIRTGSEGLEFVRSDGAKWEPIALGGDEHANALEAFEREQAAAGIRIDALYDRKERLRRE